MRKLLTISEIAEIVEMSKSQIRFYESEGLITPARIENNKYRLYDLEEMFQLIAIRQLKELNLSLDRIKDQLFRPEGYHYEELIKSSINKLSAEIKQLSKKKKVMENSLKQFISIQKQEFTIKSYTEREVFILSKTENELPSIKELFDLYGEYQINLFINTQDLYTIHKNNDDVWLGTYNIEQAKKLKDLPKHTLSSGNYLTKTSPISTNEDITENIDKLKMEATARGLKISGEIITIEDFNTYLFSSDKYYLTVQVLIA